MILTILGSGAALPTGPRRCSAQVLNVGGFKLLIDCAEGTQNGIRRQRFKLQSFSTILISHLHGDHFFGLPGLLSTMHLCGRTEPVTVVAPLGAKEVIETTFRLTGNNIGFAVEWHEMDFAEGMQRVLECPKCTVDAFPLLHSVPTYGFRITERPWSARPVRSYCYCCDTGFTEAFLPHVAGADLLCLESTFTDEYAPLAELRQHLTAGQAARLAARAGVGSLLLTHISARYKEPEVLLNQAKAHFDNTTIAADGMVIEFPQREKAVPQVG